MNPAAPLPKVLLDLFANVSAVQSETKKQIPPSNIRDKTIPEDYFFPQYAIEDRTSAILYKKGITDLCGKVDCLLTSLTQMPLEDEERLRLENVLHKLFSVINHSYDFGFKTNAHSILKDLLGACAQPDGNFTSVLFENFEAVGSLSMHVLGVSFFQRFATRLFKFALPNKSDEFIKTIVDSLFTPEFIEHLGSKLNQKLADGDLRTKVHSNLPKYLSKSLIYSIQDRLVEIVAKKMPAMNRAKREAALDALRKAVPKKDWCWLTVDHPQI